MIFQNELSSKASIVSKMLEKYDQSEEVSVTTESQHSMDLSKSRKRLLTEDSVPPSKREELDPDLSPVQPALTFRESSKVKFSDDEDSDELRNETDHSQENHSVRK